MGVQRHIGCVVPGCDGKHRGNGYCTRHYQQIVRHGKIINISKGKHMGSEEIEVEEEPVIEVVEVKPAMKYMTPAQLVKSGSDVFWRWNRENPIGWPRVEKSRLRVGK